MSSTIQRIASDAPYSEAVIHNGIAYIAGQTADGALDADAKGQTEYVLKRIEHLLEEAGSNKSRILMATVYLSAMEHYDSMNAAWKEFFAAGHAPSRATVEARMASPKYKVEIVVTAAVL